MELPAPRSTVVDLSWRPSLDYYEHGVEVLRRLQNAGVLRRFRVGQDDLQARLADGSDLSVGVVGMTYTATGGSLPLDVAEQLLLDVLRSLRPADVTATFYLQHVLALDWGGTYEEACAGATAAWLPSIAATCGLTDSAPLVDGVSRRHGIGFQAEFGVIDAAQAPARLSRYVGNRIGGPGLAIHEEEGRDHPPLALFVDSSWFPQGAPRAVEDLAQWVLGSLSQAIEEAHDLTVALHESCDNRRTTREGLEVT